MKSRKITTAWIGVHRHASDKFIMVSGVNVSFTNWYTVEPKNYGGSEDCVELMNKVSWLNDVDASGKWNGKSCFNRQIHHICEFKH